jgi:hypothetical protein
MVRIQARRLRIRSKRFAEGSLTTDAEIKRIVAPVASSDLTGPIVKGIGGYPRLVYRAEDFSSIPEEP